MLDGLVQGAPKPVPPFAFDPFAYIPRLSAAFAFARLEMA
jgi:hypothetical protein